MKKELIQKVLYLTRHAHREKPYGRDYDNGLSLKGIKQAKKIAEFFSTYLEKGDEKKYLELHSSPRKRCIETLEPTASIFKQKIQINPLLLEQEVSTQESEVQFRKRIRHFADWWMSEAAKIVIACSHGDWLPLAVEDLVGKEESFKKGAVAEIFLLKNQKIQWGQIWQEWI